MNEDIINLLSSEPANLEERQYPVKQVPYYRLLVYALAHGMKLKASLLIERQTIIVYRSERART